MLWTPFALPPLAAGIILAGIAVFVRRLKSVTAARPHAFMVLAGSAWALTYAAALMVRELRLRAFLGECTISLGLVGTMCMLLMALEYTGLGDRIGRTAKAIFALIPAFFIAVSLSSPLHRLFRYDYSLDMSGGFSALRYTPGPLHRPFLAYQVAVTLGSVAILVAFALRRGRRPGPMILLSLGFLMPLSGSILYALDLSPVRGLDLGSTALVFTGLLNSVVLFKGSFLEVTHIARDLLIDCLDDPVLVTDSGGRIADLNRAARLVFGTGDRDFIGLPAASLPPPWGEGLGLGAGPTLGLSEIKLLVGGEDRSWELSNTPIHSQRGGERGRLLILHETSRQKALEASLEESRALYLGIVEEQGDPVCRWLPDTTLTFVNSAYCRYFGRAREELIGRRLTSWLPLETIAVIKAAIADLASGSAESLSSEEMNLGPEGQKRWMVWAYHPVRDTEGGIVEFQGVGRDITARKEADLALQRANAELEAQLARNELLQASLLEQAVRDPLTGLFNRRYMEETLARETAVATRGGVCIGVMMLDIDHFKRINDERGHAAGDRALAALGAVLLANTRKMDIACRYGGEEFIVIMPGTDPDTALARAEALRLAVEKLPFEAEGGPLRMTLSAGVAVFPLNGSDARQTLLAADRALYEAKRSGRNRVVSCDKGLSPEPARG